MAFYAIPYRVLLHDTVSYGSHHFLTNFKFQCEVRDHFFFDRVLEPFAQDKDLLYDLAPLTHEGYSRNLAPVMAGQRVAILLSFEEPTRVSVRMCFRVVLADGTPVACGFQTLVCTSRKTGEVTAAPEPLLYGLAPLREKLNRPGFRERVLEGGRALKEVFDEDVLRFSATVVRGSAARLVPDVLIPPLPVDRGPDDRGIVLMFPGQGSWNPKLLREICHHDPSARALVDQADRITGDLLIPGLQSVCLGETDQARAALDRCPDLDQMAAYLTCILSARHLMAQGVMPHLLIGHSFGEAAALATGGAFDFATGIELVCHRIKALQSWQHLQNLASPAGGMVALSCDEERARSLVAAAAADSLEISIINHDGQTVVSGSADDLQRLSRALETQRLPGLSLTSRYPFHSQLLAPAVAPFAAALEKLRFQPLALPVYSPLGRGLFSRDANLAAVLPWHFVQHLVFPDALQDAYALGGRVFVECGGGRVLTGLARRILRDRPDVKLWAVSSADSSCDELFRTTEVRPPSSIHTSQASVKPIAPSHPITPGSPIPVPIAIVSLGCVLPGAADPAALWNNLLSGKSGIVDLGQLHESLTIDFFCDRPVRPDKTYSLLCGRVLDVPCESVARYYSREEFTNLPTVERFLAAATVQCLANLVTDLPSPGRIRVLLGATADGSIDYEEQLLLAAAQERVRTGSAAAPARARLCEVLEEMFGRTLSNAGERQPYHSYSAVVSRLLGAGVQVLAIDAACASSLYAIDFGIRQLRDNACDMAICGGVFAPAISSTCLFAQFQGLSATESRPLDARASGVIFGEGAALVVLKRLPDALAAGDNIRAVIRGVATSSDGRSPSVMEPKKEGQTLAMRRAAAASNIALETIQYVDAHATGTPVGDAVEFASLCEIFSPRCKQLPRIQLGSLKALIGHTGWLAGAASTVALCKALEHRTLPPQPNFSSPNPQFGIERSSFVILPAPRPWPPNVVHGQQLPRRAGVNGFGFGGCNAHLILEEFDPDHHRAMAVSPFEPRPPPEELAIVGFSLLTPVERDSPPGAPRWKFKAQEVCLPAGVRILPDVVDHMDAGQILVVLAAHEILSQLPASWECLRAETGVLVGFCGKSQRGMGASLRINLDRIRRILAEVRSRAETDDPQFAGACDDLVESIQQITPSGPHSLPGLMPNVTAGRVANVFRLTGPNAVLDAGPLSLYEALAEAERLLRFGACKLVLAGGVVSCSDPALNQLAQAVARPDPRRIGEAAILLGLTTVATARDANLTVLARITIGSEHVGSGDPVFEVGSCAPVSLLGAEGAVELARALAHVQTRGPMSSVRWSREEGALGAGVVLAAEKPAPAVVGASSTDTDAKVGDFPQALVDQLAVPIRWTTPQWAPAEPLSSRPPVALHGRNLLVLTDQPAWCLSADVQRALESSGAGCRWACPSSCSLPNAVVIDVSSDEALENSLRQLNDVPFDAVLVLKNLQDLDPFAAVTEYDHFGDGLLALLFAVAKHFYRRLESSEVPLGVVCLHGAPRAKGAERERSLHPYSGLVAGFLSALSRELPLATCKQVNTCDGDLAKALANLEVEWGQGAQTAPVEVSYFQSGRHVPALVELEDVVAGAPLLNRDSVVLVTGGARGITAVLAETVLRRFGCTLVLLGRTDPASIPPEMLSMDAESLERFEPEFYRRQLAADPKARLSDLKRTFGTYQAAQEIDSNLRAMRAFPGRVLYLRADVTDARAVDAAVREIQAKCQRLDMVVHGAGIQASQLLVNKSLQQFRAVLATKLGGLGHLVQACRRHFPEHKIHFHLVTSTFSQLGNAGQVDYGAANVAMDRIAQNLSISTGSFDGSSLGWLGWFKVGMTKGSAYIRLAIDRRLSGITRTKGEMLFEKYLSGRPISPTTHLITDLEADYFHEQIHAAEAPLGTASQQPTLATRPRKLHREWTISEADYPFLSDHVLSGVPTLPGALALVLAARTALALRPELSVHCLSEVSMERFIKIAPGRPFALRATAQVVDEDESSARITVRLLSDFVHASGRVLQRDLVHLSTEIRLTRTPTDPTTRGPVPKLDGGWRMPDPYLHPDSPLALQGCFRSLHEISVASHQSTALFRPGAPTSLTFDGTSVPFVLLDAVWRFATIGRGDDGTAVICVPLRCGRIDLAAGQSEASLVGDDCHLTCSEPRLQGDTVLIDWAEASDAAGRVVLSLRDMVGQVYGRVPAQAEPIPSITVAAAGRRDPEEPLNPFQGKIALVTGSGRGLGRTVARRLAELGATVVVNSFHSRLRGEKTTDEIIAAGGQAVHLWGSVAQPLHLQNIFREIDRRFGGVDFFVSNAGNGLIAPLKEVRPEHMLKAFRTNVVALHQAALLAADLMDRRGGGKIVAISSIGAHLSFDYFGCNGTAKAAVECLVRYLAVELASRNIQVNAISAGVIDGEWLGQFPDRPRFEAVVPRQRLNSEQEIVEALLFLLTNGGMNGASLTADAGAGLCVCVPASARHRTRTGETQSPIGALEHVH